MCTLYCVVKRFGEFLETIFKNVFYFIIVISYDIAQIEAIF